MNHRSNTYHVPKPFPFYDDLFVFARFISCITLKRAPTASGDAIPLGNRRRETVLHGQGDEQMVLCTTSRRPTGSRIRLK